MELRLEKSKKNQREHKIQKEDEKKDLTYRCLRAFVDRIYGSVFAHNFFKAFENLQDGFELEQFLSNFEEGHRKWVIDTLYKMEVLDIIGNVD